MPTLKIGALAARTGTNVPTIRYYEDIGLLPAPRRGDNGQRQYGADDVRRLGFVRRCRDFGFTIDEVRELVSAAHDDRRPCADARDLALRKLAAVSASIDALHSLAKDLADLARQCDAQCAAGCGADCRMLQSLGTPSSPVSIGAAASD